MIWNPEQETMPRADLTRLQVQRLQQTVQRVYDRVTHYRRAFEAAGVRPEQIRTLDDVRRLPFTQKTDFRDNYPFGLFAVPREQAVRIHASSGTTGKPIVVGYTAQDLRNWAEVCARCLAASGAQPGDIFQNAYGYGLFTGGLGMHYGAELMGLLVVPVSGGNTERQIMLLRDFGPKVIACTPSYALTLAEALAAQGIRPGALPLRFGVLGAEPWTEAMRDEIEEKLGIQAVNIYGLTEVIGPGVSNECLEEKNGAHVFEDHFLVEVIDPRTDESLGHGELGELVFTSLTTVLMSLRELSPHYQLVVTREHTLDDLEVKVEVGEGFAKQLGGTFSGEEAMVAELAARAQQKLLGVLGITARVTLVAPGTLPRSEGGKLRRVVDQRRVYA